MNPVETADLEFETSVRITNNLTNLIVNQERSLENLDEDGLRILINKTKLEKEKRLNDKFEELKERVDEDLKRCLDNAKEKGAGSWLSALPIEALGYVLNKQEFRDSLCLRYGWKVPNTPLYCHCGEKNSVDHALICKKGGYVHMRHDRIRDLEASILSDVCKDVRVEPDLLPVGNSTVSSTNKAVKARLDVSAVGIWSPMERTFLDVRVLHPNSPSYRGQTTKSLYEQHETEKKRSYNQRIIQVEKATFTPLVFSTTGGMAPECTRFHKKVAQLVSKKTKEEYSHVMSHLRTRLRFTLLKSTLLALRGERGKRNKCRPTKISDLSFNTVPEMPSYEV